MVIWKERQHDNDDAFAEMNAGCIAAFPKILPDSQYGITRAIARAYTPDVESGATIFRGWCSYFDS